MPFSLTGSAEKDLDEIADAIGEERGTRSIALMDDAVLVRFEKLGARPCMERARDHDLGPGRRSISFRSQIIVYRLDGSDAVILRVVHGRRDPARLSFDG